MVCGLEFNITIFYDGISRLLKDRPIKKEWELKACKILTTKLFKQDNSVYYPELIQDLIKMDFIEDV